MILSPVTVVQKTQHYSCNSSIICIWNKTAVTQREAGSLWTVLTSHIHTSFCWQKHSRAVPECKHTSDPEDAQMNSPSHIRIMGCVLESTCFQSKLERSIQCVMNLSSYCSSADFQQRKLDCSHITLGKPQVVLDDGNGQSVWR